MTVKCGWRIALRRNAGYCAEPRCENYSNVAINGSTTPATLQTSVSAPRRVFISKIDAGRASKLDFVPHIAVTRRSTVFIKTVKPAEFGMKNIPSLIDGTNYAPVVPHFENHV
jgi:hypothetical protein